MNIKVYVPESCIESDNDIGNRIVAAIGNNAGQLLLLHDIDPDELQCGYITRPSSSVAENVKAINDCDAILLPGGWMRSPLRFDAWLAYDLNKILLFENPTSANLSFLKARKLQLVIHEATGIPPFEQVSKCRKKELVDARVLYCHYAHSLFGIPFTDIAEVLGIDRTSINHCRKLYYDYVEHDPEFRMLDEKIKMFACAENSADQKDQRE